MEELGHVLSRCWAWGLDSLGYKSSGVANMLFAKLRVLNTFDPSVLSMLAIEPEPQAPYRLLLCN